MEIERLVESAAKGDERAWRDLAGVLQGCRGAGRRLNQSGEARVAGGNTGEEIADHGVDDLLGGLDVAPGLEHGKQVEDAIGHPVGVASEADGLWAHREDPAAIVGVMTADWPRARCRVRGHLECYADLTGSRAAAGCR